MNTIPDTVDVETTRRALLAFRNVAARRVRRTEFVTGFHDRLCRRARQSQGKAKRQERP